MKLTTPIRQSFLGEFSTRSSTVVSLLLLQSCSSFVLERFDEYLKKHLLVVLFLPMIIGAGGNAGCQAAVLILQRLASEGHSACKAQFAALFAREVSHALMLGLLVSCVAGVRVSLSTALVAQPTIGFVIAVSVFCVVVTSVLIGFALPFALLALKLDPGIACPSVQVVMDFLGVCITMLLLTWLLPLD